MININEILVAMAFFNAPESFVSPQNTEIRQISSAECGDCGATTIIFPGGTIVCPDCNEIKNLMPQPLHMGERLPSPVILDIDPQGNFRPVPAVNYSNRVDQ